MEIQLRWSRFQHCDLPALRCPEMFLSLTNRLLGMGRVIPWLFQFYSYDNALCVGKPIADFAGIRLASQPNRKVTAKVVQNPDGLKAN